MGDGVTSITDMEVGVIPHSPFVHQSAPSLQKAIGLVTRDFSFLNPRYLLPITFLPIMCWEMLPRN